MLTENKINVFGLKELYKRAEYVSIKVDYEKGNNKISFYGAFATLLIREKSIKIELSTLQSDLCLDLEIKGSVRADFVNQEKPYLKTIIEKEGYTIEICFHFSKGLHIN